MQEKLPRLAVAFAFFALLAPGVQAGKLEKGFEALKVHDYFQAREIFTGQVGKHPAAAWYGLSVICGRGDNPFYHLDSAYAYIQRADASFTATDDRERLKIKSLGVDDTAIRAQRAHLNDIAWDEAKALNTIAAYDRYLNTYVQSAHGEDARSIRNYLAYEEARTVNTAAAYQAFIDRYPDAKEIYQARTRLQEAVYREATPDRTIGQYEAFIAEHPESPFTRNAEDETLPAQHSHAHRGELPCLRPPVSDEPSRSGRVAQPLRSLHEGPERGNDHPIPEGLSGLSVHQ